MPLAIPNLRYNYQDINAGKVLDDFLQDRKVINERADTRDIQSALQGGESTRDKLNILGSLQGYDRDIINKAQQNILGADVMTGAEKAKAANAAELTKLNREFNRDKELANIKNKLKMQADKSSDERITQRLKDIQGLKNLTSDTGNLADVIKKDPMLTTLFSDPTDVDYMELQSDLADNYPELKGKNLDRFLKAYTSKHGVALPSLDDQDYDPTKAIKIIEALKLPVK